MPGLPSGQAMDQKEEWSEHPQRGQGGQQHSGHRKHPFIHPLPAIQQTHIGAYVVYEYTCLGCIVHAIKLPIPNTHFRELFKAYGMR